MNNSDDNTPSVSFQHSPADSEAGQCIYCLSKKGTFKSKSHYLNQGLGCLDSTLPPGYECDTCNKGALSRLDESFQGSPLIGFARVNFVHTTQKRKPPKAQFPSSIITRNNSDQIRISPLNTGSKANQEDLKVIDRGDYLEIVGTFDARNIARWLYRVALAELACLKGREVVCSERFNSARDFIMKNKPFHNNLHMVQGWTCAPIVNVQPFYPKMAGTFFYIDVYGLSFVLNLEETEQFDTKGSYFVDQVLRPMIKLPLGRRRSEMVIPISQFLRNRS